MKKLFLFISVFVSVICFGQKKQTPTTYGIAYDRLVADSGFKLPTVIVSTKDGRVASFDTAQMRYDKDDSTVKVHTGYQWINLGGGSSGVLSNSNAGAGFRLLKPTPQEIKTLFNGYAVLLDSTSNTDGITFKIDTALISTKANATNLYDILNGVKLNISDTASMLSNYLRGATEGWGINISGTQHKTWTADSLEVASWYRLYKVRDSLAAAGWNKNIYNSDGTLTGNRTVTQSAFSLKVSSGSSFDELNMGASIPYFQQYITKNGWYTQIDANTNGSSFASILLTASDGANATSAVQVDDDIVNISSGSSSLSRITIKKDSLLLQPLLGILNIDTLNAITDTSSYKPIVWNIATGRVARSTYWYGAAGGGTVTSVDDGWGMKFTSITTTGDVIADSLVLVQWARLYKVVDSLNNSASMYGIDDVLAVGQTLTTNRTINTGSFALFTTGKQSITNSTGGALDATSGNSYAALFTVDPGTTNDAARVIQLTRTTTGTAANGIGGILRYVLETNTGATVTSNELISKLTDVTNANPTSQFIITGVNSGTAGDILTLNGNKSIRANGYGAGTFTGTATKWLAVDVNGNIIEENAPGGGTPGGSNTQVQYNNSGSFGGITNATTDGTNLSATTPRILVGIRDQYGNEIFDFTDAEGTVNYLTFANAIATENPKWTATGSDTDIGFDWLTKGAGVFRFLGNATQAATLALFEDTDDGTNYTSFKSPALAANVNYTLPANDGDADQFLKTDGSGVLSWATVTGGSVSFGTDNQIPFTNSGGTDFDYSANFTFDGTLHKILANSLGVTQDDTKGFVLQNTTAAADGAQQISPALRFSAQGWKTDATAASQEVEFRQYVLPVQGAANPTGQLKLESSINGGAYNDLMKILSNGEIHTNGISDAGDYTFQILESTSGQGLFVKNNNSGYSYGLAYGDGSKSFFVADGGDGNGYDLAVYNTAYLHIDGYNGLRLDASQAAYIDFRSSNSVKAKMFASGGWSFGATASGTDPGAGNIYLDGFLQMTEQSTPSTPGSGFFRIFPETDGLLYGLNDGGVKYPITQTQTKALTLQAPTSSENRTMWYTDRDITITEVRGVMLGSSQSITLVLNYGSDRSSATGTVVASNTFDSGDSGYQTTGFAFTLNTTAIPAGSYIWVTTSATSGTINDLNLTITYR